MSKSSRKRIVVGHSYWGHGGAEIAAMWILHALQEKYDVDVVTRGGWDADFLNRVAGTSVDPSAISLITPPGWENHLPGAIGVATYQRFCRRIADRYDLRITASRVVDWGLPAIHFLSDVTWNQELQRAFNSAEHQNRQGAIRSAYWAIARLISGKSHRRPEQFDTFVANSDWTSTVSQRFCDRPIVTISPPILTNAQPKEWAVRGNSFVVLGRISPEKKIENVVEIVREVRRITGDEGLQLFVVGAPSEPAYYAFIASIAQQNSWVNLTGPIYGADKENFLMRHRYAISACDCEAFGMATAEMAALGLIPFVPQRGGQREIVACDLLSYGNLSEAAIKIARIMSDGSLQEALATTLSRRMEIYRPSFFCSQVVDLVERHFASKESDLSSTPVEQCR